jgi:hypothetical protein
MKDEERPAQAGDGLALPLRPDVVQELLAHAEAPTGELDFRFAGRFDFRARRGEKPPHVPGIEGRADGRDRRALGNSRRRRKHRRAPEAVPDQELRRGVLVTEPVRRRHEIRDVGREIGVGEFALAPAEPGEVEAQHGKTGRGERGADAGGRQRVLRAGETVGEQRVRPRRAFRPVETRGEPAAVGAGESHGCAGHGGISWLVAGLARYS